MTAVLRRNDGKRKLYDMSDAMSAGSGSGGETLTGEQQKALDEWNRAFPQMRMTAKEFLSR